MTRYILAILLLLTGGCASLQHNSDERKIAAKKEGDTYTFKTWPGDNILRTIRLRRVSKTSEHLGPDFTVHYFNFEDGGSLGLYNGGHPQWDDDSKYDERWRARFGVDNVYWRVTRRDEDVRAEALVPESEFSFWHLIVVAPNLESARSIIDQTRSYKPIDSEQGGPGQPPTRSEFE